MNQYKDQLMPEGEEELKQVIIDALEDGYDGEVSELHFRCFNDDYFIIGRYQAEEWLKANYGIFAAIETIKDYEQDNFGEVNTDLSEAEHVCNMLVYILGEEILSDIEAVQDHWNDDVDDEVREAILKELRGEDDD